MFIGHSDLITDVCFTSDGRYLLSCGDAIFLWELMGGALTPTPSSSTSHAGTPVKTTPPPRTSSALSGLRSASPRKRVPTPAAYDPLKMQVFTPMGPGVRTKCNFNCTLTLSLSILNSMLIVIQCKVHYNVLTTLYYRRYLGHICLMDR